MFSRLQVKLYWLGDPRRLVLLLNLLLLALALSGCGDAIPACPIGGSSGGCSGG